ncbi:hypothetical protein [Leptolyngbya sp. FACHB-261]|uniref:hypothetical protein n=1 Tax=Leptolyngbya sp. FACHB-261 TaxID=2692806 RepID=UPI001683E447|nr:hypothetical protein [Leptolyngbya sp. FACHB-261]MBD2099549.1 hypothetical protein [Leptolyngbya sp. FACHB-261]
MKTKPCAICQQASPLLYRIQHDDTGIWKLVCPACWPSLSQSNRFYRYGGTWKRRAKRR